MSDTPGTSLAEVRLWGRTIGAVSWDADARLARFEYDVPFRASGIQVAPLTMPLSDRIYTFPALPRDTFNGLPGLLADSLPDDFGNAVIEAWRQRTGRPPLDPVQRLCYTGTRGMGALEYQPALGPDGAEAAPRQALDVAALVDLAGEILARRDRIDGSFAPAGREAAMEQILQVGTSAGGARPKAVVAWNEETGEVRSGQVATGDGFTHWLLKFDGVDGGRDRGRHLSDPAGYGRIEYAYHLMAREAGIAMAACRLLEEGGRAHFMTRRFDRTGAGGKIHMQTFGGLAHLDFRQAGAHGYEQVLRVMRRLELPMVELEEQFRRMCFNIVARNQDDHVKNIAFLMDRAGGWSLAPAYDLTYAYNPRGQWTGRHQMSLNGKRDGFAAEDFRACGRALSLARGRALALLEQVTDTVRRWPEFAAAAGVDEERAAAIAATHRLDLLG